MPINEEEFCGMAVKIRLTRLGRKKMPYYRIVVADIESKRDGRFLDILGTYDPLKDPAEINLDTTKLQSWLEQGAKPTQTVKSLIAKHGAGKTMAG
jgi:small subunit ribosomal protein S16